MEFSHHELDHEKLIAYQKGVDFVGFIDYLLSNIESNASVIDHLNRSSESFVLNIANGNSHRHNQERLRYFDVAYGSALESSACLDVILIKDLSAEKQVQRGKESLVECVGLLLALRSSQSPKVEEETEPYNASSSDISVGIVYFAHERLDVYQVALEFVKWVHINVVANQIKARLVTSLDKLSTSFVLNIAEGNGRFSVLDHTRFLDIAQESAVKSSAYLDVLAARKALSPTVIGEGKQLLEEVSQC